MDDVSPFPAWLRDEDAPHHVTVMESLTRFSGPIFTIRDDAVRFAAGDEARRQYMEHDDAVAVVVIKCLEPDPEVLVIRQYRHAPRRLMWEVPAGLRDVAGESAQLTAERELAEEASLRADSWRFLVRFVASPGVSDEDVDIFLATGVSEIADVDFIREGEEREIETRWVRMSALINAIFAGALTSPTLVTGVLAARVAIDEHFAH